MQPDAKTRRRSWGRLAAPLIGLLLLVHLVRRAGPSRILEGIASVGWGLVLVIALAGLSHVLRTWAWRVTLLEARHRTSFGRMFALRLVSEAAGQVGVFGQLCGDAWRVAGLAAEVPLAARVGSVALDRILFTLSSTLVTFAGVTSVALLLPLPHKVTVYANIFAGALVVLVLLAVIAVRRRWAVVSGAAGALGRLGKIGHWLENRRETIRSVEDTLLDFFHHSPAAFWRSLVLQMSGQALVVLEVCLILRLMGLRAGVTSALAIEGLTKLLNIVGMINPGNAGTYEGGNMLVAKLVGVGGTAGLTLGLIRRVRALFWAAAGAVCFVALPKSARKEKTGVPKAAESGGREHTAVILAAGVPADSLLMTVGALPVLLRAILGEHKAAASRIVVVIDAISATRVREALRRTRRLPDTVEWCEVASGELVSALSHLCEPEDRLVLVAADRTYHPSLHRRAAEWQGSQPLALATGTRLAGIWAATLEQASGLLEGCPARTPNEVLERLAAAGHVACEPVPSGYWQKLSGPADRLDAERKLDQWLVKSTDGVFARMNRKVSIPISRQLIKFPITANMVSLFTLGVSFLSGVCFALGGRGDMVLGAFLSVFSSILDGSDGEVARLKMQESAFGCWLETVCDDLYYVFLFSGMMIGLLRRGPVYLVWGSLLCFGATATILATTAQRRRMAGARPEQYLTLWQAQASKRSSNPFLYLGRHTEFLMRRCCMPYLVLAFALFGGTYMAFIGAAVGSNIAWPIALYSYFSFNPLQKSYA